ncbi:MAG: RNA-binding protein [Niastella sp.]|nr:RNA-binding protein [Niastella sp.]
MKIYVSNLDFDVRDEDLMGFFTPYGSVASAVVINDRETGKSRGFGFVEMQDDKAGQEAIDKLNDSAVNGRQMKVTVARPKPEGSFGKNSFKSDNSFNRRKW